MSERSSRSRVEKIADAVLYEGYILYPYRPSAVKNQQRWNFGALCPEPYAVAQKGTENSRMRTECLVESGSLTTVDVKVRFLHLVSREVAERVDCTLSTTVCRHVSREVSHFRKQQSLEVNGKILQTWQEAIEREVMIPGLTIEQLCLGPQRVRFGFPHRSTTEIQLDEKSQSVVGVILRTREEVLGEIEISARDITPAEMITNQRLIRFTVIISNQTPFNIADSSSRDQALMRSCVSTHTILEVHHGAFVSLLDPPDKYKAAAGTCNNKGTYPVLIGEEGEHKCMLSSPIILYDYPQIAPESAGDLFDGTEIDEILTLRIMTLTDEEKREMRSADELARQLLERTENLQAEEMMKLHGMMKEVKS